MNNRIAYLAPEIPSVSATFVYREILELRRRGVDVSPFSMHACSADGLPPEACEFIEEADVLYGDYLGLALSALLQVLFHPLRSLDTLEVAATDFIKGAFSHPGTRWKVPFQVLAALALAYRLEASRAEHLHIHFAHSPATLGMYAARAAGITFSVTAHANDIFERPALLEEKIGRARPFVTISRANRRRLGLLYPAVAGRIRVIHCGVDTQRYSPRPEEGRSKHPTLLTVCRLVEKKGVDLLLDALAELREEFPRLQLQIVGGGPERAALEARSRDLGVQDNVTFLSVLSTDRIARLMERTWFFALPCRIDSNGDMDGIPVSLMEAMAREIPVVSTRLSGIPELIDDGVSGLLAKPDDRDSLVSRLRTLIEDPTLASKIGETGRIQVQDAFEASHEAGRLLSLIQSAALGMEPALNEVGEPTAVTN